MIARVPAIALVAILSSPASSALADAGSDVVLEWNAIMVTTTSSQNPFAQARVAAITPYLEPISARVYGGIHFRFDQEAGARQGRKIAQYVYTHNLLPDD